MAMDVASAYALAAAAGITVEELEEYLARYPHCFPEPVRVVEARLWPRVEFLTALLRVMRSPGRRAAGQGAEGVDRP